MKKTFYLIFTFCAVFLSVINFLDFSDRIYTAVFENKACVVVEKQDDQTNEQFIDNLALISKSAGAELLYVTVEDASAKKPVFNVYTTTISAEFTDIDSNYPGDVITGGQYLTTEKTDTGTEYRIFGSTLYNHFRIHSWKDAGALDMEHSKFYTQTATVDILAAALTGEGYRVSMVTDEDKLGMSASMMELQMMFLLLTASLFFSVICYAFSVRREIIIKKANGYDEFAVFTSTFLADLMAMPLILLGIFALSGILVGAAYPRTFVSYVCYGAPKVIAYLGVSVVLFLAACMYVQFMKSANEIRGNRPSRMLYFLAVCFRVIVCAVVIWGLTCAQQAVVYKQDLEQTKENIGTVGEEYAVLSLNCSGTDLDSNIDEYTLKSMELIEQLTDEFGAVIVDSGEYIDMSDRYERFLYVNEEYFTIQPVYDADGGKIDVESGSEGVLTILLPDNYSGELVRHIQEQTIPAEITYYASGQRFRTFNQFTAIEDHGYVTDPIIMLLDENELYWRAQSIIGTQYMLIPCDSADPYAALKGTIEQCGMSGVVLEAQWVNDIFDVAIMNAGIKVFQYSIVSVLYIAVLLLIAIFETTVYYENNKRMLTIKKLHGYGRKAYAGMFAGKAAVLGALVLLSLVMGYNMEFIALVAAVDLVVFAYYIKKLERNSIVLYLKGDV